MKYLTSLIACIVFSAILGVINGIIFKLSNIHDVSWWLLTYICVLHIYFLETVKIKWIRNLLDIK